MNINNFIYKSVLGIRHNRIFSFMDISGKVIDDLISLNGTGHFPVETFVKIGYSKDGSAFKLSDEEETLFVDCNLDGVVVTTDMLAEPKISLSQIKEMVVTIAETIFKHSSGKNSINRIGMLNYYKFKKEENSSKFLLSNLIKYEDYVGIPEQFLYRFSIKQPTIETVMPNQKYDYRNTIFTISAEKLEKKIDTPPTLIDVQIDHQIYFNPSKSFSSELINEHYRHYESFLDNFSKGHIYKALNPIQE